MRDKSVIVIGAGNIGRILIKRLLICHIRPHRLFVIDKDADRVAAITTEFGIGSLTLDSEKISAVDLIIIASPPHTVADIIQDIAHRVNQKQIILTCAAAVPIQKLCELTSDGVYIVRLMPNAPSLVGRGMNAVSFCDTVPHDVRVFIEDILACLGQSIEVDDEKMNWCVGLCGAAMRSLLPVLDGLIQAGIEAGFSQEDARRIAGQVMLGTASLSLYTDLSIEQIKSLTPMQTLDEPAVAQVFLEAARNTKSKIEKLQEKLA